MKTREYLKNLLIVVLLIGLGYLAIVTWTANSPGDDLFGLFSGEDAAFEGGSESPEIDVYPLGVSVKNQFGRHGAVYDDTTADAVYSRTQTLLRDAVKTAKAGKTVEEAAWLEAICAQFSVLYDYQCDVPLSVVSFWLGRSGQELFEPYRMRYLCLAEVGGTVCLLGKDRSGDVRFCFPTEVSGETFRAQLDLIQPNEVLLAAENETGTNPEMLLSAITQVPVLNTVNESQTLREDEINELLKGLKFNPNTVSRHVEQDGTRIFVEDISTIKISPNGMLTYSDLREESEYDTGITVSADGSSTVWEKTEAARELVSLLDRYSNSQGRLYLERVVESQNQVEVLFHREVGGVPIDCGTNGALARVLIVGNRVTEVEFLLRRYEVTTSPCVILPAKLAAAALADEGNRELSLRYSDTGTESVEADWYVIKD